MSTTAAMINTDGLELLGEVTDFPNRPAFRWYAAHTETYAGHELRVELVTDYMQHAGDNFFRVVIDEQGWTLWGDEEGTLESALAAGRRITDGLVAA